MLPQEHILTRYQSWLRQHGDTHLGVGWPDQGKVEILYRVMLELLPPGREGRLLDVGCGPARMLDWMIRESAAPHVSYTGLDINAESITLARQKHPDRRFIRCDLLREPFQETFDGAILNGVLTMKAGLPFEAMWDYATALLNIVWTLVTHGMAFNVMSKAVDWERDDLFHVPTDRLIDFITKRLSRRFILRQDYAPYEYTVYVYR